MRRSTLLFGDRATPPGASAPHLPSEHQPSKSLAIRNQGVMHARETVSRWRHHTDGATIRSPGTSKGYVASFGGLRRRTLRKRTNSPRGEPPHTGYFGGVRVPASRSGRDSRPGGRSRAGLEPGSGERGRVVRTTVGVKRTREVRTRTSPLSVRGCARMALW